MPDDIVPALPTSPFDAIRHTDGQGDYWTARELGTLLGYRTNYRNFTAVIERAKIACGKSGNVVSDHIAETRNMIEVGKGAMREVDDYRLTRYACYLIAQNADPSKEIVALAQTYFASMTREQEELQALINSVGGDPLAEVAQRIMRRQELTEAHKRLLARAREAGVITAEQYARFMNWGYKGLYAGETVADIHARKQIPARAEISDWMGAVESMANVLRARLARRMMEQQGTSTVRGANAIHYQAGQQIREWYALLGETPEEMPTPARSYQQLVKDEAARIAREEEDARGLWAQLPAPDDTL